MVLNNILTIYNGIGLYLGLLWSDDTVCWRRWKLSKWLSWPSHWRGYFLLHWCYCYVDEYDDKYYTDGVWIPILLIGYLYLLKSSKSIFFSSFFPYFGTVILGLGGNEYIWISVPWGGNRNDTNQEDNNCFSILIPEIW